MSYRPMMQFDVRQRDGTYFAGNDLRFATETEADEQARELMTRWFVPTGYRVDPSEDKPNYRWSFGHQKIIAI
jgi:hypothetical protein